MSTKLRPWSEEKLLKREDVFEALTAKALKQTMNQVVAGLNGIVTAATTPPPPPEEEPPITMPEIPSNVAPPFSLTLLETAVTATWGTFVNNELFPFLVDTMLDVAKTTAVGIGRATGGKPEVFSSDFAAEVLATAKNRMVNIGNQVWTQIQDQLTEGFAAGEGIEQLAGRLSTVAGLSTPRALVTARTEVIGAANAGAFEQMVFAGFTDDEASKEWLATEDPRTRKSHREADGQIVPLNQPFVVDVVESVGGVDVTVGTENLNFPGDPTGSAGNVINCRCSIAFVFNDDDDDEQDEEPVTAAAGFDESKVKRDSEGKFAKKASRALGGIDKLTGKTAKPGKKVMLRTKVLFGTTYQDGAIIAVRKDSDERIIWDAKNEKVLRQKKNADGKYETTETLTRGATYAKYGDEEGWTSPEASATTPAPSAPAPDPSPTTPTAPKVAEKASQGVSETGTKPFFSTIDKTAWMDVLYSSHVAAGTLLYTDGTVEIRKTKGDSEKFPSFQGGIRVTNGDKSTHVPYYLLSGHSNDEFKDIVDDAITSVKVTSAPDPSTKPKVFDNYTLEHMKSGLKNESVPGGFVFGEVDGIKLQKGYPQAPGKPAAMVFLKDEKTAKIVTFNQMESYTDADVDAAIAEMVAKPSKMKPAGTAAQDISAIFGTPKAKPAPSVDPLKPTTPAVSTVDPSSPIPAASSLKSTGKHLGTHGGQVYKDGNDKEWLFKQTTGGKKAYAVAEDVAYKLHDLAGLPTPASGVTTLNGNFGNIQSMFPNVKTLAPYNFSPASLTPDQQLQLQKEHVFDWMISNHDAHAGNLLIDDAGNLIGIDKGQAFRWLGVDKLTTGFNPNPFEQASNTFYKAYEKGDIKSVDLGKPGSPLHDFILKLQNIPDAEYRSIVRPYAEAAKKDGKLGVGGPAYLGLKQNSPFPANDIEAFLDAAVARKNDLLSDYTKFLKTVESTRNKNLGITTAPAVSLPAPSSPTPVSVPGSKPLYMSHGILQNPKTTQYSHGQIIAEHADGSRLRWDSTTKKYRHETKNMYDMWYTMQSYSKQAAYKKFGGADGWFVPASPAPAGSAVGLATPTPSVVGNPTAPTITVPKPKTAPKPKKTSTAAFDINTLSGDTSLLTTAQRQTLFSYFKYDSPGAMVSLNSTNAKKFYAAVLAAEKFNKYDSGVVSGAIPPISALQVLRSVDEIIAINTGKSNAKMYENAIVEWLKTPAGKSNIKKYLNADGSVSSANKAAIANAKKSVSTNQYKDKFEEVSANLSKPVVGTPDADFVSMKPWEAEAMQKSMLQKSPWTAAQQAGLKNYTGSNYTAINGALRKDDFSNPALVKKFADIQAGMRPLEKSIIVNRGTSSAQFGLGHGASAAQLKALVGKTVTDKGFVSTSINSGFGGSVKLVIQLPVGTPVAYVEGITKHKGEQEILLAAGTKFEILKVDDSSSWQTVVTMRVVP